MVVLLCNQTRELRVYNIGDKSVTIERTIAAQTKSGQTGTITKTTAVSSSITFLPGERKRVPGILLKQPAVQHDIKKGLLRLVQTGDGDADVQPIVLRAAPPIAQRNGSHPVVVEGTVKINEARGARHLVKE